MKVGIVGATGFGGLELLRLLLQHPQIEQITLYSSSKQGDTIKNIYPHLEGAKLAPLRELDQYAMQKDVDFLFCSAPTGISAALLPPLLDQGMRIIDLAGDYRLKNSNEYRRWYKKEPPVENWNEKAVYGLAEWNKDEIKKAQLIANPGCYPTATLLGLAPLVNERFIELPSLIIDAKSGISGAGAVPSLAAHFPIANDNVQIYKVNQHQHIPEIEQMLSHWSGLNTPITFSTHLIPMTRGIMSTMYAQVKPGIEEQSIRGLYKAYADQHSFIRLSPEGVYPSTKQVYGSNYCDIGVSFDSRTNRITVISCIDNLMKGAAGQAVHNFNLMNGFSETEGLQASPVFP